MVRNLLQYPITPAEKIAAVRVAADLWLGSQVGVSFGGLTGAALNAAIRDLEALADGSEAIQQGKSDSEHRDEPKSQSDLLEATAQIIEQAMLSPASGPVSWDDAKLAETKAQAAYTATAIDALYTGRAGELEAELERLNVAGSVVGAASARAEAAEARVTALNGALKPIVDCYGVGWKDAAKFTEAVGPFIMEARALLSPTDRGVDRG